MHLLLDLKSLQGTAKGYAVLFVLNTDASLRKEDFCKRGIELNLLTDGLSGGSADAFSCLRII